MLKSTEKVNQKTGAAVYIAARASQDAWREFCAKGTDQRATVERIIAKAERLIADADELAQTKTARAKCKIARDYVETRRAELLA